MRRAGWTSIVLGILIIIGCVLYINDAAMQHGPHSSFAQRTSYNTVKRSVHENFPRVLPVAILGCLLLMGGNVLVQRAGRRDEES